MATKTKAVKTAKKSGFSNANIAKKAELTPVSRQEVVKAIVWNGTTTLYQAPKWRIRFEAQLAPVPMFLLPPHIQAYLRSKWLGTDVWKKDKEFLQKHNVDLKIVEELKEFLSSRN